MYNSRKINIFSEFYILCHYFDPFRHISKNTHLKKQKTKKILPLARCRFSQYPTDPPYIFFAYSDAPAFWLHSDTNHTHYVSLFRSMSTHFFPNLIFYFIFLQNPTAIHIIPFFSISHLSTPCFFSDIPTRLHFGYILTPTPPILCHYFDPCRHIFQKHHFYFLKKPNPTAIHIIPFFLKYYIYTPCFSLHIPTRLHFGYILTPTTPIL
jgi:hypothetical protein